MLSLKDVLKQYILFEPDEFEIVSTQSKQAFALIELHYPPHELTAQVITHLQPRDISHLPKRKQLAAQERQTLHPPKDKTETINLLANSTQPTREILVPCFHIPGNTRGKSAKLAIPNNLTVRQTSNGPVHLTLMDGCVVDKIFVPDRAPKLLRGITPEFPHPDYDLTHAYRARPTPQPTPRGFTRHR